MQLCKNSDMVHSERSGLDYAYSREALEDSDLLSFGHQISLGMVSLNTSVFDSVNVL